MNGIEEVKPEVLVATGPCVQAASAEIENLKRRAAASPLRRARILAHGDPSAGLHEMIIVQTQAVYVRPHKHLGKPESLHVLEGFAELVFFDESGRVEEVVAVGPHGSGRTFFFRCNAARYHTLLIRSEFFAFHEVTSGPFLRSDTVFAPWGPEESDEEGVAAFLSGLRQKVDSWLPRDSASQAPEA